MGSSRFELLHCTCNCGEEFAFSLVSSPLSTPRASRSTLVCLPITRQHVASVHRKIWARTIFCAPLRDEENHWNCKSCQSRKSDTIAWAKPLSRELKIGYLHRHQSRSRASTFISIHKFFIRKFFLASCFFRSRKEDARWRLPKSDLI